MSPDDRDRPGPDEPPAEGQEPDADSEAKTHLDRGRTQLTTPGGERPVVSEPPPRDRSHLRKSTFHPGQTVAGRYQVLRFLARGGMGEVYEVEDQELRERVALKTVLPDIAESEQALERFRREIQLARKVTHPNVCRIFDIGYHRGDDPEAEQVVFLTMELLAGESLAARLHRGRLPSEQALPLVTQIAAGLGAAHRAGIVHRDLKPANVFLVPDRDGERAVITDFGLARTDAAGRALADMTGTGEILGTPAYMAPEQLEGKHPTPATDVYALGLVMYEMVTGVRAFEGDTLIQIALQRLQGTPTSPTTHLPSLDHRWEQTILRCLEREPSDRFQVAEDVASTLSGEKELKRLRRRTPAEVRRRRLVLGGAALALAVLATATGWYLARRAAAPGSGRRSVAVLGFRNVAGDESQAWISTALSEILTTDLAAGSGLRTVPGETVARAVVDLGLEKLQTLSPETLARVRSNLGADFVVLGSYTLPPGSDQIRLDLRLQRAEDGDTLPLDPVSGSTRELFLVASNAAAGIRARLGVAPAAGTAVVALPTDPEAARLYSEGVAALRRFEPQRASDLLAKAAAIDPRSPLVHTELANAYSELGYDAKALAAAEKANQLTSGLGREEKLLVEGQYLMAARQWEKAVDTYRSLWSFFPDNLEYGLNLASAQEAAGRASDGLTTVEELRKLPAPASSDPRIDLAEARLALALGDFERQKAAAQRAAVAGEERGARLLVADALLEAVNALLRLGEGKAAAEACDQALAIMERTGNRAGVAKARHVRAAVAYYQGDLADAEKRFESALKERHDIGDRRGEALTLNALGGTRLAMGNTQAAVECFESALKIDRDIGNLSGQADVLSNLALAFQRQGDLVQAVDLLNQVRLLHRELGDRNSEAATLENIGGNLYARGDLAAARASYEEALGIYRQLSSRSDIASTLRSLGNVLLYQGDLKGARNRYQEAFELRLAAGEEANALLCRSSLATVSLQEAYLGKRGFDPVEAELSDVVLTFHSMGMVEGEAFALVVLAEARLGMGRATAAREAISRAQALAPEMGDFASAALIRMIAARVGAAEGHAGTALQALAELQSEADSSGVRGLDWELRLATGEVELKAGQESVGRRHLEELRRDAQGEGWLLVSQRAAALLGE